jgi:flagella basal body P-ring formation protein FlgA
MKLFLGILCGAILASSPVLADPADPADSMAKTAFTGAQLSAELTRLLTAHYGLDGDLQLDLLRPWTSSVASAVSWQVAVDEYPNIATATMLVRCRVMADGVLADQVSVMVRASLWRDAWFTRQPIAAHTVFSPDLLDVRRVDALREHDALPASAGDNDLVFTRDMPADRMLTWHDVARRPLVRKGDVVQVTAAEGRLFISMKALALENGTRGDLVTVRNLESHKDVSALVVDEGHVEVRF